MPGPPTADSADGQREPPNPPELLVHVTRADGYAVVKVAGELDFHTSGPLREQLREMAQDGQRPAVILDLAEVTFCDSSGLNAMVVAYKAIHARGGSLVIACPSQQCQRMLTRTGVDRYIGSAHSMQGAVRLTLAALRA